MKGVIWKYYADSSDPDLRDEMGRAGCRVLNPDPDFWENALPIWSICGPRVRATLEVGDILFFTPSVLRSRTAMIPDYTCTGYLTVAEILPDSHAVVSEPRLTLRYKKNYVIDLRTHVKTDQPRTAAQRSRNIVLGDPEECMWFGRRGPRLAAALSKAEVRGRELRSRRIRDLNGTEAAKLRTAIRQAIDHS